MQLRDIAHGISKLLYISNAMQCNERIPDKSVVALDVVTEVGGIYFKILNEIASFMRECRSTSFADQLKE